VQGGKRYATSVGGVLTGMGADVIIVDDPMKANEALSDLERTKINDWACHTLFTRLNRKSDDRIVVVQQRLHEDDMIGRVQSIAGFKLLSFSAIAQEDEVHRIETPFGNRSVTRTAGEALHPAREPVEVLHKQRELMGTAFFAAQYLQSPTPPGGGLVKAEWFQRYTPGQTPPFAEIIQSWDCASKATQLSDYSVCTTWGVTHDKQIWLLDVFRNRLEYPQLKKKVRELADLRRAGKVVIEDTAAGIQLIQELKQEGFYRLHAIKPRGDKTMRMAAQTPAIEGSRVFIPREAFWLADFLHEVTMFPKGRHDDQVDSMSQALAFIGAPVAFQGLFDYYRLEAMKIFGLKPEELTHIFDVAGEGVGFTGGRGGREIKRGEDGLYRVTADEWETVGRWPGVQLLWPIEK
jgi:predicted phage terminase large subunit-like protein